MLTDEGSTIVMKTPSPADPYPMESSSNEWSNAPRWDGDVFFFKQFDDDLSFKFI
ncbi:hypothetical protein Droror1_Dr00011999, partial [Drosera rotundifolia]